MKAPIQNSPILRRVFELSERDGGKTALVCGDENVSYSTLGSRIRSAAAFLQDHGVGKGDCVALSAIKGLDFVYAYFGVHLVGATVVVVDPESNPKKMAYILDLTKPKFAVGFRQEGIVSFAYADIAFDGGAVPTIPGGLGEDDVADIVLDADYAPVIGSCEAVDAGYFDADAVAMGGGADHYGSQRVANGRIDIGAVEADWRPHYAAARGAGVTVTNASSEVTLGDDGKVHLADGAALAGFWTQLQPNRRTRYSGDVTATDGTIAGTVGETAVSVTDGADAFSFKTKADVQGFDFAFVGTGDGALSGFEQFVPGVLLMLR